MRKIKKLLAVVLSVVMILSILSVIPFTASAETEGIFTYEISDGEATITGLVDENYSDAIAIPSTIGGYPVTSIGCDAFSGCSGLTSITIPDSVTEILYGAFCDCAGLTSITIPDSVDLIVGAFCNCINLKSIVLPDSVDEISWNSFYNTGYYNDENNWLNGVLYIGNHLIDAKKDISGKYNIRPGTKSVNDSAFSGCTGLTSITIPDSVISIGDWAFSGCTALESAILPKDITYIGQEMFCDCVSLKSINIPSAVKYIGYEAFYNCTNLTDITVQNNIEEIVQFAFKNTGYYNDQSNWENNVLYMANHLLEADKKISGDYIVKPGTKTISGAAFAYCDNLKSVTIPSSVYKIGSAFVGNSLEKFIIDESNEHYSSAGNCIVEIKSKYLIAGCKNTVIPNDESVTSIGDCAFYYCKGLTSIVIPNSVTWIGSDAFSGCSGLTDVYYTGTEQQKNSIIISDSFYGNDCLMNATWHYSYVPVPNEEIFKYEIVNGEATVTGLVDENTAGAIVIPSTVDGYPVTSIDNFAFQDCYGLTSVTIPDSVTSIGMSAFTRCYGLTSVTIGNSVTYIDGSVFFGCSRLESITVDSGNKFYHSSGNCLIETASKTLIKGCNNSVIPSDGSVNLIYGSAFSGCKGLTEIVIPDSVTSIGDYAFYDCNGLTSVTIPDSVESIGHGVFSAWSVLESIIVDSDNKFYHSAGNCLIETKTKALIAGCKNCVIPSDGSVTSIGEEAFIYCSGLTEIVIPDSVTSIGDYAFYDCNGLTSITIPDSATYIGDCAFDNTTWFDSQPNGLVYAGKIAYKYKGECPAKVTIREGTLSIAGSAFSVCKGLTSIVIPDSVTSIGDWAFYHCTGLTSITIPDSVTSIGGYAFCQCNGLTSITIPDPVTEIGSGAFSNCEGLTSVTIGDSVTSIGDYAFSGCHELTSVIIPNGVTVIANGTFHFCTGLTSITIPDSITSIGKSAFRYCENLTDVYYTGTEQQKNPIAISDYGNDYLLNATWHYNYVPPCEHSAKVWRIINKATLTEKGSKQEICSRCGEILNEQEIPALGVTYSIDTAKENIEENISVAQSADSNLPETVEVKAEKTNADDKQVTYEIRLEDNGEVIQPEAPVLVKLPIPAGFDKNKLNIYRTEPDGRKTRLDFIIDGDYAYFETDHFSIYEIIEKLCGDISGDGSLNNGDLVTLFQYLSGWGNSVNKKAVDVNGDGKENNQDLVLLFQFLSGWNVEIF